MSKVDHSSYSVDCGPPEPPPHYGNIINHGSWWTWQDMANALRGYSKEDIEELVYFLQEILEGK